MLVILRYFLPSDIFYWMVMHLFLYLFLLEVFLVLHFLNHLSFLYFHLWCCIQSQNLRALLKFHLNWIYLYQNLFLIILHLLNHYYYQLAVLLRSCCFKYSIHFLKLLTIYFLFIFFIFNFWFYFLYLFGDCWWILQFLEVFPF